jgi:NTP pyrophosphatase (non-canonical NTP hydrolase)
MRTDEKYDIYRLQTDVVEWANGISPKRKPQNTVVKLVGETSELLDAIVNGGDVRDELGDMIILLLDLANMYGVDIVDAGWDKMDTNRHKRHWVAENGVIRRRNNAHINNDTETEPAVATGKKVANLLNGEGPVGSGT